MKTKIVYSDRYYVDIGPHVFPTAKYRLIKKRIEADPGLAKRVVFVEPGPAREEDILLVHTPEYLDKLKYGRLSYQEILTLELPYSRSLYESSVLCCGGTLLAMNIALEDDLGIHIGGGFHHAFPDHGEGFCVLNDIAVGIRALIKSGKIKKAIVVDCDLHQGNGTAFAFQGDPDVFTFSIHQEHNYPFIKPKSSLDIGLPDMAKDNVYLEALYENIPKIISSFKPDMIAYVAGADPYKEDQIGNLALTMEGLEKRDVFVYEQAKNYQIPIAVVLAGGYAVNQDDTVTIHFNTIRSGVELFDRSRAVK